MDKKEFLRFLWDNIDDFDGIELSQYEDDDFIIVDSWDTVKQLDNVIPDNDLDGIMSYNWGFNDEYSTCSECYNVIRTSPDSYSWQAEFEIQNGGIYCKECFDRDLYLETHLNANKLVNLDVVDLYDYGYAEIEGLQFEHGMHYGQKSDPMAIVKALQEFNIDCLFSGNVGQFDIRFYVWVRDDLVRYAKDILENSNTDLPYDPGRELAKVLRVDKSDYYHMETHEISQEDFIAGNIL